MKKKIIIVVTVVIVLALGGTLAFAAVDEDGNWVNPFTNILAGKVDEGTITQDEADTFAKVWAEIKGDMERPDGRMPGKAFPDLDMEFMSELKQVMTAKTSEVLDKLVADGVISAEDVEAAGDKGNGLMVFMKDADEETITAIKEAMTELKDDITVFLGEKVADGTLTQEQADMFSKGGMADKRKGGMTKRDGFSKRMPEGKKGTDESGEDTGE